MIETTCNDIIYSELMQEMYKQFNFNKDYIIDYARTGQRYNEGKERRGFCIAINKYTDDDDIECVYWRSGTIIHVNGRFIHTERVLEAKVTPKKIAMIVITDEFVTVYDETLYKWVIGLIKKFNLDHDKKYELRKCW